MSKKNLVIGIDLGTTFSCAAVYKDGSAKVIFNDSGNYITPSCVSFIDSEVLVGDEAVTQMPLNPENTIYDAKRLIGRQFDDPIVQEDIEMWPFKVKGINKRPQILISGEEGKRLIYPELVSALILMKMKDIAEKYLGQEVRDAVITVPAYFNDAQRRATKDAGSIAGLNVLRIINEPTAAALAYGLDNSSKEKTNVLVYDLGGGTFDVTVLTIESGIFEVKSTTGNTHLGGQDFTKRLVKYFVDDIKKETNKNVATNKTAMAYLRSSCEAAKKSLSFRKKATVILKYDDYAYSRSITQALFEELNDDLFKSTLNYVQNALDDAKMTVGNIDEVVLVGGSTRIPKIQNLLKTFFGDINLKHSLNPDEGVALGAAIQAAVMDEHCDGKIPEIVLIDVTPMSLGIETYLGDMSIIIKRHSVIPISHTSVYQSAEDDQPWIRIGVYEGEKPIAKDNNLLDEFRLENLPPGPKGTVKIDVTFDINADGILTVTAVEKSKGIKKSIVVTNIKEYLSKEEINRMVKRVEQYKYGE